MPTGVQQVINSRFAVQFLAATAQVVPPRIGIRLSERIGAWIAAHPGLRLTRTVRANQSVVQGGDLDAATLDRVVCETLQNNARDLYNLYHYLPRLQAIQQLIRLSPRAQAVIERPEFAESGLMVVGLHLSNFDLILRSICQQGFRPLVLTIPDPQGGRQIEYEMRKRTGMNLVPASVSALRAAIRHLEQGGTVVTGMDRPVTHPRHRPIFFGQPACLPTHYVQLALHARVAVIVMAAVQDSDGRYHVLASDPIEMKCDSDHDREIMQNAERLLKQAEDFIRLAPQQWNVPLPVWIEPSVAE